MERSATDIHRLATEKSILKHIAISLQFLLLAASPPALAEEADDAKVSFNNHCRTCHSIRRGDNRLGPAVFGIVGRRAGQVAGYRGYSGGLDGLIWDEATLDRFIAEPASVSSSTNMISPPIADAAERRRIIAFLKTLRD